MRPWLRVGSLALAILLLHGSPVGAVLDPVDIGVFGNHVPPLRRRSAVTTAQPFTNPYEDFELSGDPITRARLRVSANLSAPIDRYPRGVAAWGKYVLFGNYEDESVGLFQTLPDQRLGVFDTETSTFCELVISPGNASAFDLGVASPGSRQTRIYFVGFSLDPTAAEFGYIAADLDNPHPCDPATGWQVVGYTGHDLNCIAGGQLPGCIDDGITDPDSRPCPGSCGWDGLGVLDAETVVAGNWVFGRHVVIRLNGGGEASVPAVRTVDPWQPPDNDDVCYSTRPVRRIVVDPTSGADDRRFIQALDATCDWPEGTPGCAPWVGVCPLSAAPAGCTIGSTCPQPYCAQLAIACSTSADCIVSGVPIGPCINACKPAHSGNVCSGSPQNPCLSATNCPSGQQCICDKPGKPLQEFAFDGDALIATSPFFQSVGGATMSHMGPYDSQGNVWVSDTSSEPIKLYRTTPNGEHSYYDPSNAMGSVIVSADQAMFYSGLNVFTLPDGVQVGTRVYMLGLTSLQRAVSAFGLWAKDPAYKVALGERMLPSGAQRCSVSQDPCTIDADCPESGEVCTQFHCAAPSPSGLIPSGIVCSDTQACPAGQICMEISVGAPAKVVAYGGSPAALWTAAGFAHPATGPFPGDDDRQYPQDEYLERIPVETPVSDVTIATSRPSIGWTGGDCISHPRQCRLWMAAQRDGVMQVRVRDDGFWSGWSPLPTNVGTAGAPAIIANPTAVVVFARATNGRVYASTLSTAVTCELGVSCSWSSWTALPALPSAVKATQDIAATFTASSRYVAVRGSDEKVYYTLVFGPGFVPWIRADGVLTDASPTIADNPADGTTWIAIKEKSTGYIRRARVTFATFDSWAQVGATPYPPATGAWQKAPAMVWDGALMRVFVPQFAFPNTTWQTVHDGTGWGGWRPLLSGGAATVQEAAASVTGTVNLVTYWLYNQTAIMNENAID